MDEKKRLKIIEELRSEYNILSSIKEKEQRLKELKQNPAVREFLSLMNDVNNNVPVSGSKFLSSQGLDFYIRESLIKKVETSDCDHPLMMYVGSYSSSEDSRGVIRYDLLIDGESHPDFAQNGYSCICCGKMFLSDDYEKFESENNVLKKQGVYFDRTLIHEEFCRLLAELPFDDAIQYITDFYYGKNDGSILARKKNN